MYCPPHQMWAPKSVSPLPPSPLTVVSLSLSPLPPDSLPKNTNPISNLLEQHLSPKTCLFLSKYQWFVYKFYLHNTLLLKEPAKNALPTYNWNSRNQKKKEEPKNWKPKTQWCESNGQGRMLLSQREPESNQRVKITSLVKKVEKREGTFGDVKGPWYREGAHRVVSEWGCCCRRWNLRAH